MMAAQRFGGRYSPQDQSQNSPAPKGETGGSRFNAPSNRPAPPLKPIKPAGRWRSTLLFLSSFTFLLPAFGDPPREMALGLVAGGLLIASVWMTRQGLIARAEWAARRVARRPAIPRILFGAVTTGAALFVGGMVGHGISAPPFIFAALGFVLHMGAFGFDPMSDKGMEGIDKFQTDRVARAIAEAERSLSQMKDAILRAKDRGLENRVDRFAAQARNLMRRVEEDPGDLTAARKYLSVYLQGARDATAKFADLWAINRDPQARKEYEDLLTDLETTFADRSQALLGNDRTNLDIEISVLRDRLKYEAPRRS